MDNLLSIVLKQKESLEKKVKELKARITPIEKELSRCQSVIDILQPANGIGSKSLAQIEEEKEYKDPPPSEKIRLFFKGNTDGLTTQQMRDANELAYPGSKKAFNASMFSSLVHMVANKELVKLGQGSSAIFKLYDNDNKEQ